MGILNNRVDFLQIHTIVPTWGIDHAFTNYYTMCHLFWKLLDFFLTFHLEVSSK